MAMGNPRVELAVMRVICEDSANSSAPVFRPSVLFYMYMQARTAYRAGRGTFNLANALSAPLCAERTRARPPSRLKRE